MTAAGTRPAVRVAPLRDSLLLLLPALVPWLLVVAGRAVCLVAQRLPPLVRLVRCLRRWSGDRNARAAAVRDPSSDRPCSPSAPVRPVRQRLRHRSRVLTAPRRHADPAALARRADSR